MKTCPFELVASKTSKSVVGFTIKEKFCNFTHTCVASRPEVCMKSANDINIKLAVLGCGDARKAAKPCKPGGTVYDAYSRQGYALNCNPASLKRIMVRVVNRLFRVDKEGVDEALGEINDWVTKFNERQSNGLATLRTKPSDIPGGHDMFDSVTIVFRAADVATRKCGPRVYFIDAAYLAYERKDLRLGILEGTTSSNKIVPVAIHLGWGETTEFYCDMIEGIQAYSENGDDGEDTLWRHLDDKKTWVSETLITFLITVLLIITFLILIIFLITFLLLRTSTIVLLHAPLPLGDDPFVALPRVELCARGVDQERGGLDEHVELELDFV